jgi:hypothetical protein
MGDGGGFGEDEDLELVNGLCTAGCLGLSTSSCIGANRLLCFDDEKWLVAPLDRAAEPFLRMDGGDETVRVESPGLKVLGGGWLASVVDTGSAAVGPAGSTIPDSALSLLALLSLPSFRFNAPWPLEFTLSRTDISGVLGEAT